MCQLASGLRTPNRVPPKNTNTNYLSLVQQASNKSQNSTGGRRIPSFHSNLFNRKKGKSKNTSKNKKGGATKNWLRMPAGNWVVRVKAKNAAFSQRAKIVTSKGRFKLGQKPGSRVKFSTSDFWSLKIQNRPKRKKWRSSKMMKIPKSSENCGNA